MPNYLEYAVCVVDDLEIEAPVVVHARLPEIFAFVVLLCAEGGVMKVLLQEFSCLMNAFATGGGAASNAFLTASP
jgi:hypothetical protein